MSDQYLCQSSLVGILEDSDRIDISVFAEESPRLIALTGASGFVGKVLLAQLLSAGWKVRVLTREPKKWIASESLDVFAGDLVDTLDWSGFLTGVDVLIHAAGEISRSNLMMEVNVQGPQRLLNAAVTSGIRRWVQISSVGAYGTDIVGCVDEASPERPIGCYEKTKTIFDNILRDMSRQSHLQVCIVRPSNVYGAGMVNQSLFQMMYMVRRGWFAYIGPAGASANYVHVNDVVNAVMLCTVSPLATNKTYIVSAWATIESLIESIANQVGVSPPSYRLNLKVIMSFAYLLQWIPRWPLTVSRVRALSGRAWYSTKLIEQDLGWHVSVPLDRGMKYLFPNKELTDV